jgi:N-glycosylase/DNA lyase
MRRYLGVIPRRAHPRRVEATLAADPVLARLLPHTAGISLLSQDPWEILISFIISQNNNIPKIRRSIDGLSRALGEPLDGDAAAFPAPDRLAAASARTLAACALGYRAPYVRSAARLVAEGRLDLAALSRMEHAAAREALLDIPGIGEKVGDCVLLFGLGHRAAFPIDVWVRRAVERLYFRGRPRRLREIQAFARERFGALAGHAQQHLFAYARARLRA